MREASLYIEHLGYNGKVFDLEVKRVSNIEPISDEEEQVEALVKNWQPGRAGANYKLGIIIANAPSLTKACRIIKDQDVTKVKQAATKKERKKGKEEFCAMIPFQAWKEEGEKMNEDGGPLGMPEGKVVLIAKVLAREIAPTKALKDVSSGTKARAWFKELRAEGKFWNKEMEKVLADTAKIGEEMRKNSKPLF